MSTDSTSTINQTPLLQTDTLQNLTGNQISGVGLCSPVNKSNFWALIKKLKTKIKMLHWLTIVFTRDGF